MLLSIITLVSFTAALSGYHASIRRTEAVFDQNLKNFAHSLSILPIVQLQQKHVDLDNMAFQIWQHDQLLQHSSNTPTLAIAALTTGFDENNFNGQRWRSYVWQEPSSERWLIVAEPLSKRVELAEEVALSSLTPMVLATPILALLIALTITRGLAPLKQLSRLLQSKQGNDFTPIQLHNSPNELSNVVTTLNRLMTKLDTAFQREKRFSSDAAHELRTPISVLQVEIHNLEQQHPELKVEISRLDMGVQRMSHVVEQILLLNRTHPDHFKASFQSLELSVLTQSAIAHCYDSIDQKQQIIELISEPATIQGDTFAITTLLNNLISNASKYTPDQGSIVVTIHVTNDHALLMIEDSGPGIKASEYERVLDRFYRSGGDQHTSGIIGCGLGMAIVKQVVDLHAATIQLSRSEQFGGLKVTVCFNRDKAIQS